MIEYGGPPLGHEDSPGTPAASHTNDLFALLSVPMRDINICYKTCLSIVVKWLKFTDKYQLLNKEVVSCDRKSDRFHLKCFCLSTQTA